MLGPRAAGLALGILADAVLGDPRRGHPVAAFGTVAGRLEEAWWADRRGAGVRYTATLVGGAVVLGAVLERYGPRTPMTALATWAVLGGTSLGREGAAMASSLAADDLAAARDRLPSLCGRDPWALDTDGLARAALESLAENTGDAVVAPLVWGAVAGVPGLLGYRAANTLDAMVGHTSSRHRRFGWAAARLDDVANLVPARMAGLLAALLAGNGVAGPHGADGAGGGGTGGGGTGAGGTGAALRAWRRDAATHPSPNAGVVEASFAGALGVRLGGRTIYPDRVEQRPRLGAGPPPVVADLPRAVRLSRAVGWGSAVVAVVVAAVLDRGDRPER